MMGGTLYAQAVRDFRRELIRTTLSAHAGNRTRTARALGIQRTYLIRLIREFGLNGVAHAGVQPPVGEVEVEHGP